MSWIADLFAWLFDALADLVSAVWSAFISVLQSLWVFGRDGLVYLYHQLVPWVEATLPAGLLDRWESIPWDDLTAYGSDVAWILPINEVLVIISVTFTAAIAIRVVRYLIGFIPGVDG